MVQKVWISGLFYRRRNDIEFNLGVGLGNDVEFNVGVGLGDLLRWGKGSKKRRCTATANVKYVRVSKGKGMRTGTAVLGAKQLVLRATISGECTRHVVCRF